MVYIRLAMTQAKIYKLSKKNVHEIYRCYSANIDLFKVPLIGTQTKVSKSKNSW